MADETPRLNLNRYEKGDTNWDHTDAVELVDERAIDRGPVSERPVEGDYDDELYYAVDQNVLWGWDATANDWTIRGGTGSSEQPLDAVYTEHAQIDTVEVASPYDGGANITIEGAPRDQHKFSPVQAEEIQELNLQVDGEERTYLAYDSDPEGDEIRLYYTDDLDSQWTPYSGNPILGPTSTSYRWPSAILVDGTIQLFAADRSVSPHVIKRFTSTDGINFTEQETTVDDGDNPNIWQDPNTGKYVLIYRSESSSNPRILQADTIAGLASASFDEVTTPNRAAPSVNYFADQYWIYTEQQPAKLDPDAPGLYWTVHMWAADDLLGPYYESGDSPFVGFGNTHGVACSTLVKNGDDIYHYYNDERFVSGEGPWGTRHCKFQAKTIRPNFTQQVPHRKLREVREHVSQLGGVWRPDSDQSIGEWEYNVEYPRREFNDDSVVEDWNDNGDLEANTEFEIQKDGLYRLQAVVNWAADSANWNGEMRELRIKRNRDGSESILVNSRKESFQGTNNDRHEASGTRQLREGDILHVTAEHGHANSVDLAHSTGLRRAHFEIERLNETKR